MLLAGGSSGVQGRLIISSGRRQNLKHRSEEQGRGIEEEKREGSWRMEASSLVAEEQRRSASQLTPNLFPSYISQCLLSMHRGSVPCSSGKAYFFKVNLWYMLQE